MGETPNPPQSKRFDPIQDMREFGENHQKEGDLAIIVLTIVILFNLILFEFPVGYGIYSFLPILALTVSYFTQYWSREKNDIVLYLGLACVTLALAFDLIVSISYIPGENQVSDIESIPTVILDVVGLISLYRWSKLHFTKE